MLGVNFREQIMVQYCNFKLVGNNVARMHATPAMHACSSSGSMVPQDKRAPLLLKGELRLTSPDPETCCHCFHRARLRPLVLFAGPRDRREKDGKQLYMSTIERDVSRRGHGNRRCISQVLCFLSNQGYLCVLVLTGLKSHLGMWQHPVYMRLSMTHCTEWSLFVEILDETIPWKDSRQKYHEKLFRMRAQEPYQIIIFCLTISVSFYVLFDIFIVIIWLDGRLLLLSNNLKFLYKNLICIILFCL
jgi:hypothetical protein